MEVNRRKTSSVSACGANSPWRAAVARSARDRSTSRWARAYDVGVGSNPGMGRQKSNGAKPRLSIDHRTMARVASSSRSRPGSRSRTASSTYDARRSLPRANSASGATSGRAWSSTLRQGWRTRWNWTRRQGCSSPTVSAPTQSLQATQPTRFSPGQRQVASTISGCGRYRRRTRYHGCSPDVGSQFACLSSPGDCACR